jgi:hypothetical protein
MKTISKITILIAGMLFFMHYFIPHSHIKTQATQVVSSSSEIVDVFSFFSFIIDFDLGENHLNSFVNNAPEIEKELTNDFFLFSSFNIDAFFQLSFLKITASYTEFSEISHLNLTYPNANLFRGPPSSFL